MMLDKTTQAQMPLSVHPTNPPPPGGTRARARVLGKLGGRRVKMTDRALMLPDNPAGRALLALIMALTGCYGGGGIVELAPDVIAALESLQRLIGRALAQGEAATQPDPQIFNALIYCGVAPNVAAELARDEWLKEQPDRALAWGYDANQRSGFDAVHNPAGLIVSMIRGRKDPPYLDEFTIAELWQRVDDWQTKNPRRLGQG